MTTITYHRPDSLEAALALLREPNKKSVVLAGGTHLNPALKQAGVDALIDLQAVGLKEIETKQERVTVGAMVTLQTLVESDHIPPLLQQMAHLEAPNTFRHVATVGGTVAAKDPESELLAALLVSEARLTLQTAEGKQVVDLPDFLNAGSTAASPSIITHITLATGGTTAHARVARTPKDKPIVAAVGRKTSAGDLHLALCGVAATPILVQPDEIEQLMPAADFRGSSDYRRAMASQLAQRVLTHINQKEEQAER